LFLTPSFIETLTKSGVYGLPVAKTYLEVNPSSHVLILDAGRTVGGTWSLERLYDGLQTNNLFGMSEYSDFPMDFETFGVKPGSHVPGIVLHRYLTAYAERFGIFDKIRFEAFAKSAELKEDGTWVILYEKRAGEEGVRKVEALARKLVMATGTTSEPNMPEIRGAADFVGHIFHFKEFQNRKKEMEAAHNIAVLGGSKSAADAIYLNASKGKHVDWIIRGIS
jgi:cation diffusion facilitator CzcD-associated flavoprotein CzcO